MAVNRVEFETLAEVARTCAQEGSLLKEVVDDLSAISEELKRFANGDNGLVMPSDMAENTLQYAKDIDAVIAQYLEAGKRVVVSVNNMAEVVRKTQAAASATAASSSEATKAQAGKLDDVQGGIRV